MKNCFIALLLAFLPCSIISANAPQKIYNPYTPDSVQRISSINANDTVVFDIAQASINGGYVEFPVYFLSDDTINALDFSFRYNLLNFTYDSVVDLTNYIQGWLAYQGPDTVVRFTSYSTLSYTNDTALVNVRFLILSGQFCASDLNTIHVYLNGDPCSAKIITCVPSGLENNENDFVEIYPNPSSNFIQVQSLYESELEILTLDGRKVMREIILKAGEEQSIDLKNLSAGVYFVRLISEKGISSKKIIIDPN